MLEITNNFYEYFFSQNYKNKTKLKENMGNINSINTEYLKRTRIKVMYNCYTDNL